jgi:hypothetical protein
VSVPSAEQAAAEEEKRREGQAGAQSQLEKLRAAFEKASDEVNLAWLAYARDGETDLRKMAQSSGRDVSEFYAAAKRRKRAVQRLLAVERGVTWPEDE